MSYKIRPSNEFQHRVKKLSKKYASLPQDLRQLLHLLPNNPRAGTPLGLNCYKLRLAIESKGKGKSGGARLITYAALIKEEVVLLTIMTKLRKKICAPASYRSC